MSPARSDRICLKRNLNLLWPILGGVLIILANAFFVTVEFAIVTVRAAQMERLAEEGNDAARQVSRLLADTDWAIAGSQLGITVASILLGVVAEEPLNELLSPVLDRAVRGGLASRPAVADRAGHRPRAAPALVPPHGHRRTDAEDHRAALPDASRVVHRRRP